MTASRRMLLIHAHPDDESISCGTTMAHYAADGADVTLVTCTLGDEGEILIPELAHLASDKADDLAAYRYNELGLAMAALGVPDWRILGGPHTYRDSGMMGTPPNDRKDTFWQADLLEAARHLVSVIREVKPQVVITYDDFGGYGHPDHIQAHRVTMYALTLAAIPTFDPERGAAWDVPKVYWTAFPVSVMRSSIAALAAAGDTSEFATMDPDDLPFTCPDEWVTTAIDGSAHVDKKMAAFKAHATQISTEDGFFALSNNLGTAVLGMEFYRLVRGTPAGPFDELGRETDLFAGVAD